VRSSLGVLTCRAPTFADHGRSSVEQEELSEELRVRSRGRRRGPLFGARPEGAAAGALFETFVVMKLIKQAGWSTTHVEAFFYRDTEKCEVDLVIESAAGDVAAIEAKSAAVVTASDARGLLLLRDKLGPRFKSGVVVYSGEHTLPLDDRIWAVPISRLWQ